MSWPLKTGGAGLAGRNDRGPLRANRTLQRGVGVVAQEPIVSGLTRALTSRGGVQEHLEGGGWVVAQAPTCTHTNEKNVKNL